MAGASHLISPPGGFGSLTRISALPHSLMHSHLPNCCVFFSTNSRILLRNKSRIDFYGQRKVGTIKIRAMAASFGSRLEETVKTTINENPVEVYSKTWCSYSSEVKFLFKKLGVEPLVIELDELGPQGPQLQKVLEGLLDNILFQMYSLGANTLVAVQIQLSYIGKENLKLCCQKLVPERQKASL